MMVDAKQKYNSLHSSNLYANMNEIFHIYIRCHLPPPPFSFVVDGKICIKTTFCQIMLCKLNNSCLILFYTFIETLRVETGGNMYQFFIAVFICATNRSFGAFFHQNAQIFECKCSLHWRRWFVQRGCVKFVWSPV